MNPSDGSGSKALLTGKVTHSVIQPASQWDLGYVRGDEGEDPRARDMPPRRPRVGNQSKEAWKAKGVGLGVAS